MSKRSYKDAGLGDLLMTGDEDLDEIVLDPEDIEAAFQVDEKTEEKNEEPIVYQRSMKCHQRLEFHEGYQPMHDEKRLEEIRAAAGRPVCHNMVIASGTSAPSEVKKIAWDTFSSNDPARFAATTALRLVPGGTMLIFEGSRKVVNGVKSEASGLAALYDMLYFINRQSQIPLDSRDPRVTNAHCTVYLNHAINLDLMSEWVKSAFYRPESIKQLRLSIKLELDGDQVQMENRFASATKKVRYDRKITYLVRHSGAVVITGATNPEEMKIAADRIIECAAHFATYSSSSKEREMKQAAEKERQRKNMEKFVPWSKWFKDDNE
jgi:TATA-box binding protein (TBP) (component of TFIID and TFIIIB)